MTLVRYQNQLPNLLNKFFNTEIDNWSNNNFSDLDSTLPSINIKENENEFVVDVAAPGFEKEDFNIELNHDVLTISSQVKEESESKEGEKFTRKEFSYKSFKRSFTLPELVEDENISATYKNGILSIHIPKKEEAKPKPIKQISIS